MTSHRPTKPQKRRPKEEMEVQRWSGEEGEFVGTREEKAFVSRVSFLVLACPTRALLTPVPATQGNAEKDSGSEVYTAAADKAG